MNLIGLLLLKIIGGSLPHNIECLKASVVVIPSYIYIYIIILNEPEMQDSTSLFSSGFNRRTLNVRSCSGEVTNFSTNHMHLMIGVFLLLGQGGMQVSQSREEKHSQT